MWLRNWRQRRKARKWFDQLLIGCRAGCRREACLLRNELNGDLSDARWLGWAIGRLLDRLTNQ